LLKTRIIISLSFVLVMAQVVCYFDDRKRLIGEGVIWKEINSSSYSLWKYTRDGNWETHFGEEMFFRSVPCVLLDANPVEVLKTQVEIMGPKFLGVRSTFMQGFFTFIEGMAESKCGLQMV
jgi:hypothetical protein